MASAQRIRHLLTFTLLSTVVIVGAYWTLIWLTQRALLLPRPGAAGLSARPPDAMQTWLALPDGRVEAWYLPPLGARKGPAPLLLFTHGNGELIDQWPPG